MLRSLLLAAGLSLAVAGAAMAQATAQDSTVPDRPQGMAGPNGQKGPAAQPPQGGIELPRPDTAAPGTAAPGAAVAVPTSQDDCISAAQALYQAAEGRRLADAQRDRLEELLVRMETHCNARQFQEASAIASDIRIMIESN